MKKHRHSTNPKGKKGKAAPGKQAPLDTGRRKFLGLTRNGVIGLAALGAGGFLVVQHVQGAMREHDLSRIQNGTPTVVQVHDPQCSLCRDLQRETRQALRQFDDGDIDYVVANIKSSAGRTFARQYDVPHVTLLLFDAKGDHKGTIRGQRQSDELTRAFRHILPD